MSITQPRVHVRWLWRRAQRGHALPPGRRSVLLSTLGAPALLASELSPPEPDALHSRDYTLPGPFTPARLPRLEHTCGRCFPACTNNSCLLRIDVWYPRRGEPAAVGAEYGSAPYPLAIFSPGFLVPAEAYASYGAALAAGGYVALLYDKVESVFGALDDVLCVSFVRELIDWAAADPTLRQLCDTRSVYLVGHSRGAKVAALAAAADARIAAACLIDPVDNTVYAPLGPGFPSATDALRSAPRPLPLAVIGAGIGGDCVPREANHGRFYAAATGPAWQVVIPDSGHFQFLDKQTVVQQAICAQGFASDTAIRRAAQAVMLAWADAAIPKRGPALRSKEGEWVDGRAELVGARHHSVSTRLVSATTAKLEAFVAAAARDPLDKPLRLESRTKGLDMLRSAYADVEKGIPGRGSAGLACDERGPGDTRARHDGIA